MPVLRQVVTNTLYGIKGLYGRNFEDPEVLFEEFEDPEGYGSTDTFFVNFPYPYMNGLLHLEHTISVMTYDLPQKFPDPVN